MADSAKPGAAKSCARLAYENRDHVSERERLFITYQYHDRFTGDQTEDAETLEVWKRTYPRDYRPANALAVLLNRLGDYQPAVAEAEEAIKRNPAHAFPQSNLAYALRGAGRLSRERRRRPSRRSRATSAPVRCAGCSISSPRCRAIGRPRARSSSGRQRAASASTSPAPARQVAAFRGRMTEARQLYAETIAAADARRVSRRSRPGYAAQAALTEAVYGFHERAAATGAEVVQSSDRERAAAARRDRTGAGRRRR